MENNNKNNIGEALQRAIKQRIEVTRCKIRSDFIHAKKKFPYFIHAYVISMTWLYSKRPHVYEIIHGIGNALSFET